MHRQASKCKEKPLASCTDTTRKKPKLDDFVVPEFFTSQKMTQTILKKKRKEKKKAAELNPAITESCSEDEFFQAFPLRIKYKYE